MSASKPCGCASKGRKRSAVVAVAPGALGLFLAVSRRGNPTDLTFPGGWVEPGEDPAVAVLRELREETGYQGKILRVLRSYEAEGVACTAYEVEIMKHGRRARGETGSMAWVPPAILERGAFGSTVKRTLSALRR